MQQVAAIAARAGRGETMTRSLGIAAWVSDAWCSAARSFPICLALVWAATCSAAGPEISRDLQNCEAFERSLLLYDRRSALVEQVREAARQHDAARSFQPGAVAETGPDAPSCAGLADLMASTDTPDAADLSRLLDRFPALIVVRSGDAARVDILANAPDLSLWASAPLVRIAGFAWRDGIGSTFADDISARLDDATRFASSIGHFHQGDLERATADRPASEGLDPLARAWLSGIPVALSGSTFSLEGDGTVWDEMPSKGAKRPFELIVDIAQGRIAPATAMKLSIPANDVVCDAGNAEDPEDVRWAGFVSGFWRALERGDQLQPDDRLSSLPPLIAAGRTCFDATLHPLLASMPDAVKTDRLLADLDRLVSYSFAAPSRTERRQRLAAEMVAALIASALLQADEESDDNDTSPGPGKNAAILQCHGREVLGADPVTALISGTDPDIASPLGAMLAASRAIFAAHAGAEEDTARVARFLRPGTFEWIRSYDDLVPDMIEKASARNPDLGDLLLDRLSVQHLSGRISKIAEVFFFSDDTSFAEKAPGLRAELLSFERQSQLANHILAAAFGRAFRSAFGGALESAVRSPVQRRAYERFIAMFPRLAEDENLQFLWRSSDENKIRVAGIDLLHLYFAVTSGNSADSFPVGRRNPWTLFAPDTRSLPEIPIPAIEGFMPVPAVLVAASAIAHATLDADPDSDALLLEMERIDIASLNGPAVVWLDVLLSSYLEDDAPEGDAYSPSPAARRIFANLPTDLAEALQDDETVATALDGLWEGRISSWTAALALLWDTVIRTYAEERLSEAVGAVPAAAALADFELGVRVAGAYLFPAEIDARAAVADLHDRLLEGPGWPDALTRLAARAALDLMPAPETADNAARDANRAALLAEFDALVRPEARQRLIDAGFLPAAIAGLPLRIAFVARDNDGLVTVPEVEIARAVLREVRAFDYTAAATEGPLRDLAEVLLVYHSDRMPEAATDRASEGPDWALLGQEALDLLGSVRKLADRIDPSAEAQAVGQGILLDEGIFGSDRLAGGGDRQSAGDSLETLRRLVETCPNLAPTLAPVEIMLKNRAGETVDVPSELERLEEIVREGGTFLTGAIESQVTMMGVKLNIEYAPGLPRQIADVPTGVFSLGLGASVAGLGTPWTVASSLGLVSRPEIGSLPFAHALTLAEAAADQDDRENFARLLVLTETLAVGGDPFADAPQAPPARIAPQVMSDDLYLGIAVPGLRPLQPLIGYATAVETRLLHLAARAEQRGMPALARRIAGLAVAIAVELPTEPIDPPEGNPSSPEDAEEFQAASDLRAQRRELVQTIETGFHDSGLHLARLVAAGVVAVPEGYARSVLCESASADGTRFGCPDLPAFTRAVPQATAENGGPGDARLSLLPSAQGEVIPDCERFARQAFLGRREDDVPPTGSGCLNGPLRLDHAAIADTDRPARDMSDALRDYLDHGVVPLIYLSDPATLGRRTKASAARIRMSDAAQLFRDAAQVSIGLLDPAETVFHYANLYVFAAIADPDTQTLNEDLRKAAADLAPFIANETARDMLLRLSQDGAPIDDADRSFAGQVAGAFYNNL